MGLAGQRFIAGARRDAPRRRTVRRPVRAGVRLGTRPMNEGTFGAASLFRPRHALDHAIAGANRLPLASGSAARPI